MNNQTSSVVVVLVFLLLGLGYAVVAAIPSQKSVNDRVDVLNQGVHPIDTSILNSESIKSAEKNRVFGTHPVSPSKDNIGRRNPFDGV